MESVKVIITITGNVFTKDAENLAALAWVTAKEDTDHYAGFIAVNFYDFCYPC